MYMYVYISISIQLLFCSSDVINGIKMEDAGGTASAVVDVEASLNSLKLNDLSTPRNVLSFGITKTEPDVFNRLEPGRFGPKG